MMVWGNMKKILAGGLVAGCMMMVSTTTLTGCLTDENKDTVVVPPKKTAITAPVTIAVGAQGAALGSVLDLDAGKALSSLEANAAQPTIDLVFMYYGAAFHMDNPTAARLAGINNVPPINLTNTYDVTKIMDLKIVKIATMPADQEAAKVAFDAGTASPSNVIVGGEKFIVKTSGGKLCIVTVGTIVGTDNKANANFMVSLSTI